MALSAFRFAQRARGAVVARVICKRRFSAFAPGGPDNHEAAGSNPAESMNHMSIAASKPLLAIPTFQVGAVLDQTSPLVGTDSEIKRGYSIDGLLLSVGAFVKRL